MSKLLEIFGRAITINTADLIWHWLDTIKPGEDDTSFQKLEPVLELLADMRLDQAQNLLKSYLAEDPGCVFGRMVAAAIYIHKNELENAVGALQSVYMRQPYNTMTLYALGYCYERLGKEAEAIEFYQDCLKFKNFLKLPRERMAAIYLKNVRIDKTIHEYEQLKKEYPDDVSSLVILGHLYILTAQYDLAIDTFNTAILIHPDNFSASDEYNEIDILLQNGQCLEAIDQLNWQLDQHPERPDLVIKLADVHAASGDSAEAIAYYEKALRAQPDFLEANVKLGTQYLKMERYSLAAQQFNRAVEINDEIVDAYVGLAIAQKMNNEIKNSCRTLSLAFAIQANSTLLFAEAARLQLLTTAKTELDCDTCPDRQTLTEAVVRAHENQINADLKSSDVYCRYGLLLMHLGKLKEAADSFENALLINPTYHRARTKLALCLLETGQKKRALAQLVPDEAMDRNLLELHYKTAILYCDRAGFSSAIKNLQRSVEQNFTSADTTTDISVVLQNIGLIDRVNANWDSLLRTNQNAFNS